MFSHEGVHCRGVKAAAPQSKIDGSMAFHGACCGQVNNLICGSFTPNGSTATGRMLKSKETFVNQYKLSKIDQSDPQPHSPQLQAGTLWPSQRSAVPWNRQKPSALCRGEPQSDATCGLSKDATVPRSTALPSEFTPSSIHN